MPRLQKSHAASMVGGRPKGVTAAGRLPSLYTPAVAALSPSSDASGTLRLLNGTGTLRRPEMTSTFGPERRAEDLDGLEEASRLREYRIAEDLSWSPEAAVLRELGVKIQMTRKMQVAKPELPAGAPKDPQLRSQHFASKSARELLSPDIVAHLRLDRTFIRTFVKSLNMSKLRIREMDKELAGFAQLQELILTGNEIAEVANVPPSVEMLSLNANRVAAVVGLPSLGNLAHLGLAFNALETLSWIGSLGDSLRNLRSLDVSFNRLVDLRGSLSDLGLLPRLALLHLEGNPFSLTAAYRRHCIASLPKLVELDDLSVADEREDLESQGLAAELRALLAALPPGPLSISVSLDIASISYLPGWPGCILVARLSQSEAVAVPLEISIPSRAEELATARAAAAAAAAAPPPAAGKGKAVAGGKGSAAPVSPPPAADSGKVVELPALAAVGKAVARQPLTYEYFNSLRMAPSLSLVFVLTGSRRGPVFPEQLSIDVSFILEQKTSESSFTASVDVECQEVLIGEGGSQTSKSVRRTVLVSGKVSVET